MFLIFVKLLQKCTASLMSKRTKKLNIHAGVTLQLVLLTPTPIRVLVWRELLPRKKFAFDFVIIVFLKRFRFVNSSGYHQLIWGNQMTSLVWTLPLTISFLMLGKDRTWTIMHIPLTIWTLQTTVQISRRREHHPRTMVLSICFKRELRWFDASGLERKRRSPPTFMQFRASPWRNSR